MLDLSQSPTAAGLFGKVFTVFAFILITLLLGCYGEFKFSVYYIAFSNGEMNFFEKKCLQNTLWETNFKEALNVDFWYLTMMPILLTIS